jgi:SAM-dependent methyltransferase
MSTYAEPELIRPSGKQMNAQKPSKRTLKQLLRPWARQTLSPRTVQRIRFQWWYLSRYVPLLATSHVFKRMPEVRGFGAAPTTSPLAKRLQSVNLLAPTKMCRVMSKYGSDKGGHKYTPLYSALLQERGKQALRIFELGVGTNNPSAPSNMGAFGAPGASLRGWRELFPHAQVYGADIDRDILFQEDRIKTFYCNQLDRSSVRAVWSHPELQGGADIIIEDGLHTFEANVCFLEESLEYLRPGGIYVTEDIESEYIDEWYARLETVYSKQYPQYEFAFVVLANPGCTNLLFIRRCAD